MDFRLAFRSAADWLESSYLGFYLTLCLFCCLCLCLWVSPGHAFVSSYTPLAEADRRAQFKLKYLADQEKLKTGRLRLQGLEISLSEEGQDLLIAGRDEMGAWQVVKAFSGLGTRIYEGDLDGDGGADLVITSVTGGCGMAPPTVISTLMRDPSGRPHFFEMAGYSGNDGGDTENIIVLPRQHNEKYSQGAVLVQECMAFRRVGERDFSYWTTVLYRAANAGWHLVPSYRQHKMPLVTRYRFQENHQLVKHQIDVGFENCSSDWPESAMKEAVLASVHNDGMLTISLDGADKKVQGDAALYCGSTGQVIWQSPDHKQTLIAAWDSQVAEKLLRANLGKKIQYLSGGHGLPRLVRVTAGIEY